MLKLSDPVDKIPLIGPKYKEILAKLDILNVEDMLFHFPTRHKDTSQISLISELNREESKTIKATVSQIKNIRTRSGKYLTQATVSDESESIEVIWFNQRYLTNTIKPGSKVLLNGKLNPKRNTAQFYSPKYEVLKNDNSVHLGKISPIYSLTEGVSNKWIRSRINYLLTKEKQLLSQINSSLPQNTRKRYDLLDLSKAIFNYHFPENRKVLELAQKTLAFEELYIIQVNLVRKKLEQKKRKAIKIKANKSAIKKFIESLSFELTSDQDKVIWEIYEDLQNSYPANRLLQGDVGSGKTVVAAAITLPVIKSDKQVAIMAPTAILAKQHYQTFQKLFQEENINIALITGNTQSTKQADIIIGTHALLHRAEEIFSDLALLIIDEQHRFGVKQRRQLAKMQFNKKYPHKITMTATPIPRSVALTLFGDLDISTIKEMPQGRKPTRTYLVSSKKRENSYKWLKEKIKQEDSQIFWICPLIEESDKLQVKAVETEFHKLEKSIFPNSNVDLLHGRMSEDEKNKKIQNMQKREIDILVSTSVIEVGMDIKDATIIVIEGAERFGLAQLHQLRGRVGRRADQKSWCFLFTSKDVNPNAVKRLKYFSKVNDGLKVAKYDLKNRGPGEVYGTRQSGIPSLKVAKLDDLEMIEKTREAAKYSLKNKSN